MKYFLFRLIAPRLTFIADMTPAEREVMRTHAAYWTGQMNAGRVVVFGPVADPRGPYGIAVIRLDDGSDPRVLAENDPAIMANVGFGFEIHPMPSAVLPGAQ